MSTFDYTNLPEPIETPIIDPWAEGVTELAGLDAYANQYASNAGSGAVGSATATPTSKDDLTGISNATKNASNAQYAQLAASTACSIANGVGQCVIQSYQAEAQNARLKGARERADATAQNTKADLVAQEQAAKQSVAIRKIANKAAREEAAAKGDYQIASKKLQEQEKTRGTGRIDLNALKLAFSQYPYGNPVRI